MTLVNSFLNLPANVALPPRFNNPFYYEPHPLALAAAQELQQYLSTQRDWSHDFGLDHSATGLGKMFGVLVVQDADGNLGYLAAFSGKLANSNHHPRFVPPVFDTLRADGFYRIGEEELNQLNRQIVELEQHPDFIAAESRLNAVKTTAERALNTLKQAHQAAKKIRDQRRLDLQQHPDAAAREPELTALNHESARHHFEWKDQNRHWKQQIAEAQGVYEAFGAQIRALKEIRKRKSGELQELLFREYHFFNAKGERKNLKTIFQDILDGVPPAGAGECAAPKLLQYAFLHQLKPVQMAEFWWGQTPASEIRKHGQFYPACRGKCFPILSHMLTGLEVDPNPLDENPAAGKTLPIVYEDEHLLVVNKPAEFLSVPGKKIDDSVYSRVRALYPDATGPLIVHRLDMSTSGLLLVAKTKEVHQFLQAQFAEKRIEKRYVAQLNGLIEGDEGWIDLPLRVDLDDRPRQLVCFEHGKPAQTRWKVIRREANTTWVHFFPITGRTHQLRVHAAHPQGLNTPIVGDELYGTPADRLYLHAEWIRFEHPVRGWMEVFSDELGEMSDEFQKTSKI
jgi:tRNA pseudouridine32 synthase / 23S rRNA pseudouridine746 synthase